MNLRPGPGKLVVQKIDLENTVIFRGPKGEPVNIYVKTGENTEAIVARVTHVAKPWIEAGSDQIHNPEYDVGTHVVIGRWTGSRVQLDREEFIVMREEDVLLEIIGDLPKLNIDPAGSAVDQGDDTSFSEMLDATPPV